MAGSDDGREGRRELIFNFETVPRKLRAEMLVPTIKSCSGLFVRAYRANDAAALMPPSRKAWDALTQLFDTLRNEADQGRLQRSHLAVPTGLVADDLSTSEQGALMTARNIRRAPRGYTDLTLRNTLNKVAHHDPAFTTFRVDGRGGHYLILGGEYQHRRWVAEILVSRLCRNAQAALGHLS